MRTGVGRVAATLAIVLGVLWTLGAGSMVVIGVLLALSGQESDAPGDAEGFAEFIGGGLAVVGGLVLAAAVATIVLAVNSRRGRRGAQIGLGVLFLVFAGVSGLLLASAIADETGADPGGIVMFGLNTAVCLAVAILALGARAEG